MIKKRLEVKALQVAYPCGFELGPVSFTLAAGTVTAVIGESGSGKTTLARTLARMMTPKASQQGEILLDGLNLMSLTEKSMKPLRMTELAMVFQNSKLLLNPATTLRTQLYEVLKKKYHNRRACEAEALRLMSETELPVEALSLYPHEISGGMTQKFMLACAIALNPGLIILDEPTSALDGQAKMNVLRLIRHLASRHQTAFLLISHDLQLARQAADRLLVLYRGQVMEAGQADMILDRPGHPYTRSLIQASADLNLVKDIWGMRRPLEQNITGCPFWGICTQSIAVCEQERPGLKAEEQWPMRRLACHRGGIIRLLQAEQIKKNFGRHAVLKGATLTLYSGEILALIGHSGAGKTTLSQILAGFLRSEQGAIHFPGLDQPAQKLMAVEGGLQMVFQDADSALNPHFTVRQTILEPLVAGLKKAAVPSGQTLETRARQILADVGLTADRAFLDRSVTTLSGGQKQRVALARALIIRPAVLIADEPAAMLDGSSKANMMRLLRQLQNQHGFAMLIITHDLVLAAKMADRILQLEDGVCQPVRLVTKGDDQIAIIPYNSETTAINQP